MIGGNANGHGLGIDLQRFVCNTVFGVDFAVASEARGFEFFLVFPCFMMMNLEVSVEAQNYMEKEEMTMKYAETFY